MSKTAGRGVLENSARTLFNRHPHFPRADIETWILISAYYVFLGLPVDLGRNGEEHDAWGFEWD